MKTDNTELLKAYPARHKLDFLLKHLELHDLGDGNYLINRPVIKKWLVDILKAEPEKRKCQCKKSTFTRTVDENFDPLCGKCGYNI